MFCVTKTKECRGGKKKMFVLSSSLRIPDPFLLLRDPGLISLPRNWLSHLSITFRLEYSVFGADIKESACNAGDPGSIPGPWRSPGEDNGNPLQYSCLENSMDRGAWQTTVHGVTKSGTRLFNIPITWF